MNYEQPLSEDELQIMEAYSFAIRYKDSVHYLNTIQEYTAEVLITEGREKLSRKLTRLRKKFKGNSEAFDVLADLELGHGK